MLVSRSTASGQNALLVSQTCLIFLIVFRYYALDVSYFKSTLDQKLLDSLWNKYWINTLSSSALLTVSGLANMFVVSQHPYLILAYFEGGEIFSIKDLSRRYPFKFFKGGLPQNLLSPLLNTLSHIQVPSLPLLHEGLPGSIL